MTGQTNLRERDKQYAEAEIFLSGFALWTAKLPVLLLLARIFGVYRGVRLVVVITVSVLGMATAKQTITSHWRIFPLDLTNFHVSYDIWQFDSLYHTILDAF